jgi:preprotein translocase subunit Sss1
LPLLPPFAMWAARGPLNVSDAFLMNDNPSDEFSPLYNLATIGALGLGLVGFVAHSVIVAALVPSHRFLWLCAKFGPLGIWWVLLCLYTSDGLERPGETPSPSRDSTTR